MSKQIDCLLIGYNEPGFKGYEKMVKKMGVDSGAYKDLNLNFIQLDGEQYPPVGLINKWRSEVMGIKSTLSCADPISLAVICLKSYLDQKGFTTDYINVFQTEKQRLKKLLRKDVKTVAVTTTFYVSPMPIIEIIDFIRKYNKEVQIILGGPFVANQVANNEPENLKFILNSLNADLYISSSQGEYTLSKVLEALKNGEALDSISNLIFKKGSEFVINEEEMENNDLEENQIQWELFESQCLGNTVNLRTARGCPYSCAFCGYPIRAGEYTYQSVGVVEEQLNQLHRQGDVKNLAIIDDTFNIPLERFKEICKMMIRNQYGFNWYSYIRCQYLDEETVQLMKEAGCQGVFLGIESGSSKILNGMNKHATIDKYRDGIRWLKKYGILTFASFIVGFPGETEETVKETIEFIEKTQPDFYRVQMWYGDPITPIYQEKEKYAIEGHSFNWKHATMDSTRASELIDKIFLTVENSNWLAQYHFDFWIIPYLRGKGMTKEQFTHFVQIFNTFLKDKFTQSLTYEEKKQLIARGKESCRF